MPLKESIEQQGNFLFKHRGSLPLILIVIALPIGYYSKIQNPDNVNSTGFKLIEFLCFFISILGLLVRAVTVGYTPSGTSGRNTKQQIADSLNTSGIYSCVRHPLYLGNFLMWAGVCLMTYNFYFFLIFILLYWIYYERIMFAEEEFLRSKYGKDYIEWASKTPAFLPKLSRWTSPGCVFNFKKILRQEKNGLLAIFVMFSLFGFIGEGKTLQDFASDEWYWIVGLIFSSLLYSVLKFLKYKTGLLTDD